MAPPRILIIAGSDSGGGAGIQADIKTVTMLGGYAMTAITAITAQNTLGVEAVMQVPAEMVLAQMDAVLSDLGADAVKIGMIGSAETAGAVAERLERLQGMPIVFDPVMVATSGSVLADEATISAFERLIRAAALVTPNLPELMALTGTEIGSIEEMEAAARALAARTGTAVLAKGGHLEGAVLTDLLVRPDGTVMRWESGRIDTVHTHGTGCTLASAIAVGLGDRAPLQAAIERARLFVRVAMREAPGFGGGHGPMGHAEVRLDVPPAQGAMLNQVTLPASDFDASVAFYRLVGLVPVVLSAPRYARFEMAGGMTLSIEVKDEAASTSEYFFQCANVDAETERLIGEGLKFDIMPEDRPYLWRVAETRDPHGNRICLYETGESRRFPPWRVGKAT